MSASALLRRPEYQVGNAAAVPAPLALALQPVPPRGPQVPVGAIQFAEPDVGHPLAGLPGAHLVEIGAGVPLRAPYPAKHFQGLIGLAAHQASSRTAIFSQVDCSSCPRSQRAPIKRSLIRGSR